MVFYLPCKLGEKFVSLKFHGWVDGKRVFTEDRELTLKGVDKSLFSIVCITATDRNGRNNFLSYGEYGNEYNTSYKIIVDDKYFEYTRLSEWGFPGNRVGKLIGIMISEGYVVADFCTEPRYEHIYFAIKDFEYKEEIIENIIVYDLEKDKQRERKIREKMNKFTHREELVLSEEEKAVIVKLVINSAREINLKLRKSDIDKKGFL